MVQYMGNLALMKPFYKHLKGRKCAYMALSALLCNQSVAVHSWTQSVVDNHSRFRDIVADLLIT